MAAQDEPGGAVGGEPHVADAPLLAEALDHLVAAARPEDPLEALRRVHPVEGEQVEVVHPQPGERLLEQPLEVAGLVGGPDLGLQLERPARDAAPGPGPAGPRWCRSPRAVSMWSMPSASARSIDRLDVVLALAARPRPPAAQDSWYRMPPQENTGICNSVRPNRR